jgi:hypothetical protein
MESVPPRSELLERFGSFYGEERFAVAFTAGTTGQDAKRVTTKGWDQTQPLADGDHGAGLIAKRGLGRTQHRRRTASVRPSASTTVAKQSAAPRSAASSAATPSFFPTAT